VITDIRLLSELNELQGTRVIEWLQARMVTASVGMINANDDRTCAIQAGRCRELTEIIKEIEGAKEEYEKQRHPKANMSKAF